MNIQTRLTTYASKQLRSAQAKFAKNPNAGNWNACLRTMLVYQQAHYVLNGTRDWSALFSTLERAYQDNWDAIICQHTLGQSVNEALESHAYA